VPGTKGRSQEKHTGDEEIGEAESTTVPTTGPRVFTEFLPLPHFVPTASQPFFARCGMVALMTCTQRFGSQSPHHVAIILDGNGRWATQRGLPRVAGHRKGSERVREVVRAAGPLGISYLTLFALSLDNRKRPEEEVWALYGLLEQFARTEQAELLARGAKVEVIGDVPSLPPSCQRAIKELCDVTAGGTSMVLRLAVAYGARQDMAQATRCIAEKVAKGLLNPAQVTEETVRKHLWSAGAPDPDLLIRTGGEKRLSDFLLLESAYAELCFLDIAWPDFTEEHLRQAVRDFAKRERKFGLLPTSNGYDSQVASLAC
jgi:undecaprenyl diphosphate synthase